MWLSERFCQNTTRGIFLLGLLFLASAIHLGLQQPWAVFHLGIGCACFAFGIAIYSLRLRHRAKQAAAQDLTGAVKENDAPTRFRLELLRSNPDGRAERF
jgi:hypothetical protein